MVKHKLKRHFITKDPFAEGVVYRVDKNSRGREGTNEWFILTMRGTLDGKVYYHCNSNCRDYDNMESDTDIENANHLVNSNYWIRQE